MPRTRFASAPALLAASLVAQQAPLIPDAQRDRVSGLGRLTLGPVHLDAATGQRSAAGCAYLGGEIFVASRGTSSSTSGPHSCFVFDTAGSMLRSFLQQRSGFSAWGWRDGASDGAGTLVFGYEGTFEFVDRNGAAATAIQTANGARALPAPTLAPSYAPGRAILDVLRAVAYDPTGDGGDGSLYAADYGSDIVEFRVSDGTEIRRLPHDGVWSLYGLALDPVSGNLWGSSAPTGDAGEIVEIDATTGLRTGKSFPHAPGVEGGLDVVPGGLDGRNNGFDLVAVAQGAPDLLSGHRVDLYDAVRFSSEVELLAGLDGGPRSHAAVQIITTANASWELDLDDGDPAPRALDLAAVAINLPAFALPDAGLPPLVLGLFPSLREIRYVDAFTAPAGMAITLATTEASPPIQVSLNGIAGVVDHRGFLRAQALYVEPAVPANLTLMATNQVRAGFDASTSVPYPPSPAFGVRVSALGNQSYNAVTASGFWRIANTGSLEILKVVLTLPATMVWDDDQDGMADSFVFGDSAMAGCRGTFRNGSHVATDLMLGHTFGTPCDTTSKRGYLLSADARTLTLVFADGAGPNAGFTTGEILEWDADTDGGGVTADAHAGTSVSVWVRDPGTEAVMRSMGSFSVVSVVDPMQEAAVVF